MTTLTRVTLARLRDEAGYRMPPDRSGEGRIYLWAVRGVIVVLALGALLWGLR